MSARKSGQRVETHENLGRDQEAVAPSSDRAFGLVFAGFFVLVALWPLLRGRSLRVWSLEVAAVFLLAALVRPGVLGPLNRAWTRLGLLLHRVTTPVVLGLLFFGTITPMGVVMRLLGKDLLRLRFDLDAKSYWIERKPPGPAPETMSRQF